MASTLSKSSGSTSLAALLLLVAVLAGAHAAVLEVKNDLDSNDIKATVTEPELGSEQSVFVEPKNSGTITIQATNSFTSAKFIVEVFGQGPLGKGSRNNPFNFAFLRGKKYSTEGDIVQRIISLTGYTIRIVGGCETNGQPGITLEGYTNPPVASTPLVTVCALRYE